MKTNRHIYLVFDPQEGKMTLTDQHRNILTIDEFVPDTQGLYLRVLGEEEQKHLSKFLI